jgi:hypothetical protein
MPLDDDEKIVYQEGNRIVIAYSQLTLMAGSIFISTAFAIFGLSFNIEKPPFVSLLLMGVASGMLYLIFLVYNERYGGFTHKIIFPMLQGLEKKITSEDKDLEDKLKIHTAIKKRDDDRKKLCSRCYTMSRTRFWNYSGFWH